MFPSQTGRHVLPMSCQRCESIPAHAQRGQEILHCEEDAVSRAPWEDDAEAAERELNAPLAPWEGFVPVYLPVAETPPARPRPFKRPPPTLGRVAPMPGVARTRTAGQWVTRYSALTTASDLRHVLQVGINVLVELRQEQRRAAPVGGLERLASARLLKPLWSHPALREETAGVLAVLEQEVIELVEALELVPIVQRGSGWEMLEAARARAISAHWERLEEIVAVLRKQVRQRGAARRLAATLAGLAWKALVALAA